MLLANPRLLRLATLTDSGARTSIQRQSRVPLLLTNFILRIIDEVPALHKVPSQVLDNLSVQAQSHIRPSHARGRLPVQLVLLPVRDVLEVEDSGVVVVLAREDDLVQVCRMDVGDAVLVGVPASEAQVQAAHECHSAVDQAELLVVCPVENDIVVHAVYTLDCLPRHPSQRGSIEREVLEGRCYRSSEFLGVRKVVGMTENCDVGVEVFQMVLCVGGGH